MFSVETSCSSKKNATFEETFKKIMKNLSNIQQITSGKEVSIIKECLKLLRENFPGPMTIQKLENVKLDEPQINWKCYLIKNHSDFLHELIRLTTYNWPINDNLIDSDVSSLMLIEEFGFLHVTLSVLLNSLKLSNNVQMEMIALSLIEILESDVIFSNLLNYVLSTERSVIFEDEWNDFVQTLISLPNRVFNAMGKSAPVSFIPENYAKYMLKSFIQCITFLSDSQFSCNVKRISYFLSRIIVHFKNSAGLLKLIDLTSIWCDSDKTPIKLFQNILLDLDHQAISVFSILLLLNIPFDKDAKIYKVLGPDLIGNKDWFYHLTSKIPFANFFSDNDNLIKNLILYLQLSEQKNNKCKVLYNLIKSLLEIWSSETSCKQTSFNQHLYITKLLLFAVKLESNITSLRKDITLTTILYEGVAVHLKSSLESYRYIGMFTAEYVFQYFNEENGPELKFEYDMSSDELKVLLIDLKNISSNNDDKNILINQTEDEILSNFFSEQKLRKSRTIVESHTPKGIISDEYIEDNKTEEGGITMFDDEGLDSDDDLVPYDMSNDKVYSKVESPMFLKDLRDGLLETENVDIFTINFNKGEELILSQLPHSDPEMGLELLQILINMHNNFYVENYEEKHFQMCVTIVTIIPKEGAEFLASEFHTESTRYSVNIRVYILDILKEAARKISSFKRDLSKKEVKIYKPNNIYQKPIAVDPKLEIEKIISKRLESKTRRITSKTVHPFLNTKVNEFNKVANSFFYPLLYGLSKNQFTISVKAGLKFDTDHILLVHFLDTISAIMLCSKNLPMAPKFAEEILEFVWCLRFHLEPKVRLAVMHSIASVVISTPVIILQNHLFDKLLDIRDWLMNCLDENVVQGIEPNSDCKIMAGRVLSCLNCVISDGIPLLRSNNYLD